MAPLKVLSTPRLELCGAALLAGLMESTRQALGVLVECCYAWSDSTTVLAWLDGSPQRYKTYVGNRLARINSLLPPECWKHVPTLENPADCASRGVSPGELVRLNLWWDGPPWLRVDPVKVPPQPRKQELSDLASQEEKKEVLVGVVTIPPALWLEGRYSDYQRLVRITAWVKRAWNIFKSKRHTSHTTVKCTPTLSVEECNRAESFLYHQSQCRSFQAVISSLSHTPPTPLSRKSRLLSLTPYLAEDGLLHVGGRLSNSSLSVKHPIILLATDHLCHLLLSYEHVRLAHCGPALLLASTGERLHLLGAKRACRTVCTQCVVCRKVAAAGTGQQLGQLPAARVTPNHPFSHTGVDYAGPFQMKLGRVRRPVHVKVYVCIFVCMATKADHLEVVTDATSEAFIAAMRRFTSRRGLPAHLYSDHGSNFKGAAADLKDLYAMLEEDQTLIHSYMLQNKISWHHIPERAPHFGGLWEACIKSFKFHLHRMVTIALTYEEWTTVCCQEESCLNSRPLGTFTSHPVDGVTPLTPGHFLLGRPLTAYPETELTGDPSHYRRWNKCQAIAQQLWRRWSLEYLMQLQSSTKWKRPLPNFEVGDMVMVGDQKTFQNQWVLGRVVAVHPGQDGLVRAADVEVAQAVNPFPTGTLGRVSAAKQLPIKRTIFRRSVVKLCRLFKEEEGADSEQDTSPVHPPPPPPPTPQDVQATIA